jgi:hypothetical protein
MAKQFITTVHLVVSIPDETPDGTKVTAPENETCVLVNEVLSALCRNQDETMPQFLDWGYLQNSSYKCPIDGSDAVGCVPVPENYVGDVLEGTGSTTLTDIFNEALMRRLIKGTD